MKKHLGVYYLLTGDANQVSVYFLTNKISNLSMQDYFWSLGKCQPSSGLLCLFRNKGIPSGNSQNEKVISKLFSKSSTQVKWEGSPFWSGQEA